MICATPYLALYKAPATECAPLPFETALLSSVRGVYRATIIVAYIHVTPEAERKAWRTRQMLPDVPVGRLLAAQRTRGECPEPVVLKLRPSCRLSYSHLYLLPS